MSQLKPNIELWAVTGRAFNDDDDTLGIVAVPEGENPAHAFLAQYMNLSKFGPDVTPEQALQGTADENPWFFIVDRVRVGVMEPTDGFRLSPEYREAILRVSDDAVSAEAIGNAPGG